MNDHHQTIRVSGVVQGVYFRAAARREAVRLGLTGFARNEPDGAVLIEVEGPPAALTEFIAWCQSGPPRASVSRVDVTAGAVVGYAGFTIR